MAAPTNRSLAHGALAKMGRTIYQDGYSGPIDSLSNTYLHYRLHIDDYVIHRILTK